MPKAKIPLAIHIDRSFASRLAQPIRRSTQLPDRMRYYG